MRKLEEEEVRRRVELAKLVKTAFDLYTSLGVSQDESAKFMEKNSNVSDEALVAWQTEIERLKEMERQGLAVSWLSVSVLFFAFCVHMYVDSVLMEALDCVDVSTLLLTRC